MQRVVSGESRVGRAAAELFGVLEEEEDEHEEHKKGRERKVHHAAEHESKLERPNVSRERLPDAELSVEHGVEHAHVERPLEGFGHAAGEQHRHAEAHRERLQLQQRLERQQPVVDERDQKVVLAHDATGDVVRGQLVLDDAQARGALQLDDLDHELVPRDHVQVRVVDLELVAEERMHLEEWAQLD